MSDTSSAAGTCLTVRDLAERFRVTPVTIRLWVKQKKLPAPLSFSGRLRWDAPSFERWLSLQREGAPCRD